MELATLQTTMDKEKLFDEVFLPFTNELNRYAYNLTKNTENGEDLLQETMAKAFKNAHQFKTGTNAKAWLFTIMRNEFINAYRKKSKAPNQVDLEDFINFHDSVDSNLKGFVDIDVEMFGQMFGDELTMALGLLKPHLREIIILKDVEGFSYEEIGKIQAMPIGTVRSSLHRARNTLKIALLEYGTSLGYTDNRK